MKKRTLSLLLTLVMLLSLCPAMSTTAAAANPAAGYYGIEYYDARPLVEHSWFNTQLQLQADDNMWCVFYANVNGTAGDYLEDATFSVTPGSPELEIELVRDWQNDSDELLFTTAGHPVWMIRATTLGSGTLLITSGGVTYEMPYTVRVPGDGFFDSTDITAESYLGGTFLYDDSPANRTFYYLNDRNLTIRDVFVDYIEGSYADGDLEWSIAPDGKSVKFTIPAGKAPEGCIGFGIDIEWSSGGTNTWYMEINLANNVEALRYHEIWYNDNEQPYLSPTSFSTLNLGVDYGNRMVFFYGTAENAIELKNPTVTSSDPDILLVRNVYNEPGVGTVVRVVGKGLGTVTLTVESNGKTYTMPVTVGLPDMGLYTKQNPIPANFVYPYVYDSSQDTVLWAMTEDGWQNPRIERIENYTGHVDMELVERANKPGYYDVKVTIPKGQRGGVEFYLHLRESNGHGWGTGFWVTDNTPGLLSRYVDYWDGMVYGWNGLETRLYTSLVNRPTLAFHYGTMRGNNPLFANSLAEAPVLQVTGENGKPAPIEFVPIDICAVSNSDLVIYEGRNLQLGSGTVSATVDGTTYSMPIEVGMPQFYPYTRNEFVEDAILMNQVYDSTKDTELWMLTENGLKNPSLTDFHIWRGDVDWEFVERANKPGYYDVKITIPKDTAGEVEWRIEVQSENDGRWGCGMWLEDVAVRTRVDYAYWRDNELRQEDWRYSLLNMAPGQGRNVVLYYGSPDEAYTLNNITFNAPPELTVEKLDEITTEGNAVYRIGASALGIHQLPYTAQYTNKYGQTLQVSDYLLINCDLPEFYPYTDREIDINNYMDDLVYTSGEDNVFWLMTEDGHEGKPSIELQNHRGRVQAEAVERPDKPGYYDIKVTIPETTTGDVEFYIHVRGNNGGWGNSFQFQDSAPHLAFRWTWWEEGPDGEYYLVEADDMQTGPLRVPLIENSGIVLYYGSPTMGYKPVSCPTMDLNDAPEVTITKVDGNGPAVSMTPDSILGQESKRVVYRLRGENLGLSVMSVTIDGETYSMQVVGQMPDVALYSTDTISEDTVLKDWAFSYTANNRSFYLISQPNGTIERLEPIYFDDNMPKDFLTVEQINDQTWKLTVKPEYDFHEVWFDLDFTVQWDNGNSWNSRWGVAVQKEPTHIPEEMQGYQNAIFCAAFYQSDGKLSHTTILPEGVTAFHKTAEEEDLVCRFFCLDKDTYAPLTAPITDSAYPKAVKTLSNTGLLMDNFAPKKFLDRAEAAQLVCRLILGPDAADKLTASYDPFTDIDADHPYAGYIAYATENGLIGGYSDGSFKPDANLTAVAVMKILLSTLGYDAVAEGFVGSNWDLQVLKKALELGLTDGLKTKFNSRGAVTHEEACLYVMNLLNAQPVAYPTNPPEKGTARPLSQYPTLADLLFGKTLAVNEDVLCLPDPIVDVTIADKWGIETYFYEAYIDGEEVRIAIDNADEISGSFPSLWSYTVDDDGVYTLGSCQGYKNAKITRIKNGFISTNDVTEALVTGPIYDLTGEGITTLEDIANWDGDPLSVCFLHDELCNEVPLMYVDFTRGGGGAVIKPVA